MGDIQIRSAKEQEREWRTRVKIRTDTKKLLFNFGKTVSSNIARKMAKENIKYAKIENLYVKSQSHQIFHSALKAIFNCSAQTREKIFAHFSQKSKKIVK